jgi:hypothetical protein
LSFSIEKFIGIIIDLEKLTFSPVEMEKELRRALRRKSCLLQPTKMIKVSSAYWRIGRSLVYWRGMGRLSKHKSFALLTMA